MEHRNDAYNALRMHNADMNEIINPHLKRGKQLFMDKTFT